VKAATYCRYSSDQQRATSIADQQRNCARRAEQEGWEIVVQYADEAISGADASRPQYLKMIAAAMQRQFDALIVDDLSRLARDSLEQERVIRRIEYAGVRIVSGDGYDSEGKAKKIIRAIHGMKNEMFRDELADKVRRGMEGTAILGRWLGGRPFG